MTGTGSGEIITTSHPFSLRHRTWLWIKIPEVGSEALGYIEDKITTRILTNLERQTLKEDQQPFLNGLGFVCGFQ
jgi:hypothetical protein